MFFAVLFQIVTLPVEFDASKRALEQVVDLNIVDEQENRHCRKVLTAAALTCAEIGRASCRERV